MTRINVHTWDVDPPRTGMSRERIIIHPERIRSWGLSKS